uniref:Flotillin n=1 Tax=Phallusia mammillata TaxID=59560 RepID=A0A6F9DC97_9ASCI|nr:flotillin-2 [Phallusia mammillata]
MGNCHTTGPNQALVVSGGCCGADGKKYVIGGWAWAWCCVTEVQHISLEVMTLNPTCENVETAEGVPLTVTGVAQVKVMTEKDLLSSACEQFLGKTVQQIEDILLQTLEGHLRAILGTLTVEQIYQDRETFASLVREVASPDVGRMGIEILSFVIKDVVDKVDYLSSIGRAQTAQVKRDAKIGVAESERDSGMVEARCDRALMDVKFDSDTKIADSERAFKMSQAAYQKEVNTSQAEAQLAYQLQAAKEKQKIRKEEIEIEVVQRRKQIDVEAKEIERKDRELEATVRRPTEAEAYKVKTLAEGKRTKVVEAARADAERIKQVGGAEASSIEAIGKAEAESMRQKAAAYKQYGDAALMSLVLESLPKIAAEVSAPLSRVDEIVLLGGDNDRTTSEVTKLLAELPPAVQAVTGVDISKVLKQMPGAK